MGSVLKRTSVELSDAPAIRPSGGAPARCGEKSVELIRVDGRPYAIELTCSCGERTLVELVLDGAPTPPNTPDAAS